MRDTGLAALASLDVHLSIKLVPRPRKQPMVLWFDVAGKCGNGKLSWSSDPFENVMEFFCWLESSDDFISPFQQIQSS